MKMKMKNFTPEKEISNWEKPLPQGHGFLQFTIGSTLSQFLNCNSAVKRAVISGIRMPRLIPLCLILISTLFFNAKVNAQAFTDVWSLTSSTTPATTGAITSAIPTFGSGVTNQVTNNGTYGFEGRGWPTSGTTPLATANTYFQFQVTPSTGYTLNITGLTLISVNNESYFPDYIVIYCSTSSTFSSAVTTVANVAVNNNGPITTSPTINVTANSGQTMYFRIIYYYNYSTSVKFGATKLTLSGTSIANCTTPSGSITETDASGTSNDDKVCSGGSATLTAPTGSIYAWSTGATTAAITPTGITSTTAYSVTVSNTSSCTASFTNTVTMTTPSVSITETDASGNSNDGIVCNGGTASLAATSGYTYLWTSGATTSSINTAALSSTTSYTVTATSAGCTASASTSVTVAPTPGVSITETDNSGTSNDGKVCTSGSATLTANPTGGTAYTYLWTGGTTASTLGVSPGSTTAYSVTVTNAGCSAASATTSSTVTVVSPPSAAITETDASGNANDGIVCSGGTASLSVTTGTGFTYAWSTTATTSSITTPALSTATTYNVTVSNAGCSATGTSTVAIAAIPSAALTEADASGTSNDGTVCQSGTATISAPNTAGYTYLWNTSATTYNITTPGLTSNTSYSVTVTNDGCSNATAIAGYTVTADPAISVAPTGTGTICYNKTISANTSGGSGTISSYSWSGGLSAVASPPVTVSNTYTVTVTDSKACTATGTTGAITVDPAVTASPTATSSICYGATISAGAGGGTSPYTYAWSGSLAATATPAVTATGTYTVTITDNKSCSVTGTTGTITVDPAIVVSPTGTSPKCYNATISAGVSGGTSPYTYAWSGGLAASATPAVTTSGTYTVTVTDNKSCTATGTTGVITVDPAVTASPTGASTICSGGTIAANAGGGSGVYSTYVWSGGLAANAAPTVTTTGTYAVTITDNAGCSVTGATGVITIAATPSAAITEADASGTSNDGTVCQSGTATLSTPNTAGYTYHWNTGETTYNITTAALTSNTAYSVTVTNDGCSNATASASYTVTADQAINLAPTGASALCYNATISANASGGSGTFSTYAWSDGLAAVASPNVTASNTYTVTVTDSKGCSAAGSTGAITVNPALTVGPTGTSSICSGSTISAGAGGGTPAYTYAWSGGLAAVATPVVTTPGTYLVTVTDSKSCSATGTTGSITIYSTALTLSAVPTNETTCNNGSGAMTLSNSGGSGSYHYLWSNGATTQNLSSLTAGSYTVTVTDVTCTAVSSTTSGTVTAPWVAYAGGFDPLCTSSVDLAASVGGNWPTTSSSGSVFYQDFSGSFSGWTTSGTYGYSYLPEVSTAHTYCNSLPNTPCVVFDSYWNDDGVFTTLYSPVFSLSGVSSPSLSYSLINKTAGHGFWVLISTDGGNTWTTIQTNPNTTGNGYVTETVNLSAYAGQSNCMLAWELESDDGSSKCNNHLYLTDISVTGSVSTQAPATYAWSGPGTITGSTSQFATANATGTYTVSVTINGCTAKGNTTITTPVIPAATITASPATVCPGSTSTLTFAGLAPGGLAADFNGTTSSLGSALLSYADNFTVEFWVKPTAAITMTSEVTSGVPAGSGESYAITPASTGSSTTSGAGVSVGTNGLIVFENSSSNLPSLLVYNGGTNSLNGWNHVALVYANKTPSIYINGNFVMEGLTSTMTHVYASLGTSVATYGPFSGYLDDIRVWNGAKTQAQIAQDMFLLNPITTSPVLEDQYTFNSSNANDNVGSTNLTATSVTYAAPSYFTYTVTGTGAPAATTATNATTSALTNSGTSSITNTYDVTASTTGGCTGISTSVGGTGATVVVKPNASVGSVTGTSPLCVTGTTTFTANSVVLSGGTGSWTSSNTSVATVNSSGLVTATGAGICNIIYTITGGCGGTASAQQSLTVTSAPSSLTYTINAPTYCPGSAITTNSPSNGGGVATLYSVSPALPTGLSLNTGTGAITGTPTTATTAATYTVTASNTCGNTTDGLVITISPAAPTSLTYTLSTSTYCPGNAITANSPGNGGGAPTSYSVSPALPAGLNLNTSTGVISGTPTTLTATATYTVTASNSCGNTTDGLSITIANGSPTSLTYTINSPAYCPGSAITTNSPSNSGGAVTSYSVSPALPTGLSLNTSTGAITGTPTTTTATATYTVTASNSCGSTTDGLVITISPAAPTSLSYTLNTAVYCPGSAITANSPTNSGGAPTSYSVSPALPAGLSLNTGTGVITGTPTTATAIATYTVTATNSCGNTTKGLSITISPAAPTSLTYTINSPAYCPGSAISTNSPGNSGGAPTSYSVSPALPAGLSLNTGTGAITGTPTTATAAATYTVTATNSCGNTTDGLTITIAPAAPVLLTYTLNTAVYCPGSAITANSPSNSGGAPTSYSVSPALPAGLSLNTGTGVITGTPTTATAIATYTVTATNSCGNTTKGLSITISPAAPTSLTYTINSPVYCPGSAITTNSPSRSGGAPTSYSVSPALPTGLSLNTSTGAITGTPTTATSAATYTVTATNSCGSTTDGLIITISPAAPTGLNYTLNSATYCPGTAIASNSPTTGGGAPTSYSVSPALPAGLSLNTGTGVITGIPTTATTIATYTVTATNSCGSTSDGLSITISPAAPTSLTYTINSPTYCPGTAITTNSPGNAGGAPTSYSISPALPGGLSLNTATGAITGTPAAATAVATYTVTATNSCGSTTDGLSITISPAAPTSLTYTLSTASYCVGSPITTNSATSGGGAPTSYSVSPALPAGLSLNTGTGDITGTPAIATASATYTVTATNSCGSISVGLTIAVDALVSSYGTITASAGTAQSLCSSVTPAGTFSVTGATGGSGSFSYQWYSQSGIQSAPSGAIPGSWTLVNGATNNTFAPSGTTSSISYACAVTPGLPNCAGTTTWASGVLNFTVSTPTAFITGGNDSVCATTSGTNVLTASTTYTATWQWQSSTDNLNFTNISGATSTTYAAPTSSAGVEYYHAVATYSGGSGCTPATSNNEYVAVNSQPAIVTQPGTVSMCQGGTGNLGVVFSGGVGATYQWQVSYGFGYSNVADNNSNAQGVTYGGTGAQNPLSVISSATSYTGTLPYKVIIHYSGAGCTPSLTSSAGAVTINSQVVMGTQPAASTSICSGSSTSLSVSATRGYTLSYEWQYYNSATSTWADVTAGAPAGFSYTGATGTTLSINTTNGTSPAGSYNYHCIVHSTGSDCNPVTSNTGTIVVIAHPASFTPTVSANPVCITSTGGGTNIQVANSVSGVNYQLQNITGPANVGSAISGTGSTINLPTGSMAANAIYQVVATAVAGGCTTTSSLQDTVIAVNPDIAIGTQLPGQHFTFGTTGNPALPVGWTNPVTSGLVWALATGSPASSGSYSYYNGSGGTSNASTGAYVTTPTGASATSVSLISGTINTTGYSNISVQWGAQKSAGYAGTVNLYYSTDNGSTWSSAVSFTDAQDNLTANPWVLVNNGVQIKLPATCNNISTLKLMWTANAASAGVYYSMNDIGIYGLSTISNCGGASISVKYLNTSCSANAYSIGTSTVSGVGSSWSGLSVVSNSTLPASAISVAVPSSTAAGTYDVDLTVNDGAGHNSNTISFPVGTDPVMGITASLDNCSCHNTGGVFGNVVTVYATGGSGTYYFNSSAAVDSLQTTIDAGGISYSGSNNHSGIKAIFWSKADGNTHTYNISDGFCSTTTTKVTQPNIPTSIPFASATNSPAGLPGQGGGNGLSGSFNDSGLGDPTITNVNGPALRCHQTAEFGNNWVVYQVNNLTNTGTPVAGDSTNNTAVVEIQNNGVDLDSVSVSVYRNANLPQVPSSSMLTAACEGYQGYAMERHFMIKSTNSTGPNSFSTPVGVRLYFTDAEFQDLKYWTMHVATTATGQSAGCAYLDTVTNINSLYVTKYTGPNEDGDYNNNSATPSGLYRVFGKNAVENGNSPLTAIDGGASTLTTGGNSNLHYVQMNVTEFSEFWLGGSSGGEALPVSMLYMEAEALNNDSIQVRWATAIEVNNHEFNVERSTDGQTWSTIATLPGHENSTHENDYFYNDLNVTPGVHYYYRLKQVDNNGNYQYTDVVQAMITGSGTFTVMNFVPNPTAGSTQLTIMTNQAQEVTVDFYDMLGQRIYTTNEDAVAGNNRMSFDLRKFAPGTYSVVVTAQSQTYTKKIVITR